MCLLLRCLNGGHKVITKAVLSVMWWDLETLNCYYRIFPRITCTLKKNGTSIHAISFDRRLFSEIRQNVRFRIRQMLLKGQKCWGNLSKWRIDEVFLEMDIEKKNGTSFHESWTSSWSLFSAASLFEKWCARNIWKAAYCVFWWNVLN